MKKMNKKTVARSKKLIKKQARSSRLPVGHIDLVVDYASTLKGLNHEQITQFYTRFYTPIKQACAQHNLLLTGNKLAASFIEQLVDSHILVMNTWLLASIK
jgi:hypothetical protein